MIVTFKGNDPLYAELYHKIAATLKRKEGITFYPPHADERYIYWDCKDYFAHGGVQMIYDTVLYQYILKNIVFFIDFDLYSPPLDEEEHYLIYDQIGLKFYQAIYLELGKIVTSLANDPRYLLLELPEESLTDCLIHGCWPCQDDQSKLDSHYHMLFGGLSSENRIDSLKLLKQADPRVLLDLKANHQNSQRHLSVHSYSHLEGVHGYHI